MADDVAHAILPDVPTIAGGPLSRIKIDVWFGVLAPAGTPRPIVDRLNTEITAFSRISSS